MVAGAAASIDAPSYLVQLWEHDRLPDSCPRSVPFEEDDKDPRTWFLDHNFVESMTDMFKKVNGTLTVLLFAACLPPLRVLSLLCSSGEAHWMVPYWSQAQSIRLGDQ